MPLPAAGCKAVQWLHAPRSCRAPFAVAFSCMDKLRPTYDLSALKAAFSSVDRLSITTSALRDAVALGFDRMGIVDVIGGMEPSMFYKSMTTFADHRLWQDVYHVPSDGMTLYVKFQADLITVFKVMAFKEK